VSCPPRCYSEMNWLQTSPICSRKMLVSCSKAAWVAYHRGTARGVGCLTVAQHPVKARPLLVGHHPFGATLGLQSGRHCRQPLQDNKPASVTITIHLTTVPAFHFPWWCISITSLKASFPGTSSSTSTRSQQSRSTGKKMSSTLTL
jgi:hypothetical protein